MANESSTTDDAEKAARDGKRRVRTGVAVGIGSAAIVAALLYANRGRKGDRNRG
jgi:hypothetical protein